MLDAAKLLEDHHRGLDWEKVRYIRRSDKPPAAFAREFRVSDVLIGNVRRGELWNREPGSRNRNDIPRRAVLGTLVLGGPRVKELCWFDGHHVDLPGRRLRVPRIDTKSVAGVRMVPMLPGLHELLLEHRANRAYGPHEPVFPTRNGTRNTQNNILSRIVVPVRAEANRLLAEREQEPIDHLTPHTCGGRSLRSSRCARSTPPRTTDHGPRGLAYHGGRLRAGSRRLRSRHRAARRSARMRPRRGPRCLRQAPSFRRETGARCKKSPPRRTWKLSWASETVRFAGTSEERLKGLEPSTFCMASRRSSQLSYSRKEAAV